VVQSHPSGTFDTTLNYGANAAARLYICDALLEARDEWAAARSNPGAIRVVAASGIGTGYNKTQGYLQIDMSSNDAQHYPDYYDRGIIVHEYGHWLSNKYSFLDEDTVSHNWSEIVNPEVAGKEGFCHTVAAWVWQDPVLVNRWLGGSDSNWYNVENGEWEFDGLPVRSANALGKSCEGSVAGIFWDIFDGNDDDYSSASNWGSVTIPHTSDGIEDSLSNGIDNILSALLDRNVNGHHPDNISEFWEAWFQFPELGHVQAMRDI
jgi:hypothetical protein